MLLRTPVASSLFAFVLFTSNALALTTSYGLRQIAEAGDGCVGGVVSDHSNAAYFCGDTAMLNRHLASLAVAPPALLAAVPGTSRPVKVVLHTGRHLVDRMEEQPQIGLENQQSSPMAVDWLICRSCVFDAVRAGRCEHEPKVVTVHVWISGAIDLGDLYVPAEFAVEPGREIERFVKRHAGRD